MRVIVTGATGFVGKHLVTALLARQHAVTAIARDAEKAKTAPWFDRVQFVPADIANLTHNVRSTLGEADVIVHLAWPGLPNYKGLFHFENNLPQAYAFLRAAVKEEYARILVTGTCFEYGMQEGRLSEQSPTIPDNPYGLAKDTLRKFLELLQRERHFGLQWCRLFYTYGEGQGENSLLSQLEVAIDHGESCFMMSGGEQLRDFLPIEEIAQRIVKLVESPQALGVFNVCSGKPISIRKLVEDQIQLRGSLIQMKLGVYPYPDYEPFAFWGDSAKYHAIESQ